MGGECVVVWVTRRDVWRAEKDEGKNLIESIVIRFRSDGLELMLTEK